MLAQKYNAIYNLSVRQRPRNNCGRDGVANARTIAIVTGGCGGMGRACAREFGKRHDLVLTDISQERLDAVSQELTDEGYTVRDAIAGDLSDGAVADAVVASAGAGGGLGVVLHTAGVSSGMADWETIIRTNILGTHALLDRVESLLSPGTVAVLIASIAGHLAPVDRRLDAIFDDPRASDFMRKVEIELAAMNGQTSDTSFNYSGMSGPAYGMSKRATIRQAELRCADWAKQGARIVSISPGIIWTPMGRWEVENGESAGKVLQETPLERWGTAMDIAEAAAFLASGRAGFITGTDLRIDGGMIPVRIATALSEAAVPA